MMRKTYSTFVISVLMLLVASCSGVAFRSQEMFGGNGVNTTGAPNIYFDIIKAIEPNSVYMWSQERIEALHSCAEKYVRDVSNEAVNRMLDICVPEDRKLEYFSPEQLAAYKVRAEEREAKGLIPRNNIQMSMYSERGVGYLWIKDVDAIKVLRSDDEKKEIIALPEVEKIFTIFRENNIHTLFLDLRDNPGGQVEQTIKFMELLLHRSKVPFVTIHYKSAIIPNVAYVAGKDGAFSDFRIIVFVNRKTASAAEIIAGALQQDGAIVIGERTYGKGSMQLFFALSNGGIIKMTIAITRFADGTTAEKNGIIPNIELKSTDDYIQKGFEYLESQDKENHQ